MQTPPPSWEDVEWLRHQWDGPILLKGVCRVDDARRAVEQGVSAISASNHGGNNLDSTPAAIRGLQYLVDAVDGDIEVLLDGGIHRGSDVANALAIGARAVRIGRAYLWGLAANGKAASKTSSTSSAADWIPPSSAWAIPPSAISAPTTSTSHRTSPASSEPGTQPPPGQPDTHSRRRFRSSIPLNISADPEVLPANNSELDSRGNRRSAYLTATTHQGSSHLGLGCRRRARIAPLAQQR